MMLSNIAFVCAFRGQKKILKEIFIVANRVKKQRKFDP